MDRNEMEIAASQYKYPSDSARWKSRDHDTPQSLTHNEGDDNVASRFHFYSFTKSWCSVQQTQSSDIFRYLH